MRGKNLFESSLLLHKFTLEGGIHRGYILENICTLDHPLKCFYVEYLLDFGIKIVVSNKVGSVDYLAHKLLHYLFCLFLIKGEMLLVRLGTPSLDSEAHSLISDFLGIVSFDSLSNELQGAVLELF